MITHEDIARREQPPWPSEVRDQEPLDTERDESNFNEADPGQWESNNKKLCVLVGSAILQLPIWGFAMSYGVFQEFYFDNWALQGGREATGIIGTTSNGVMYLSMTLFTRRWARRRQAAALCGAAFACINFVLSSFSTTVWHLVMTQGVLAAFGCFLVYSSITLSLGEWFNSSHGTVNRAVAYGIVFPCKNIIGSACPFLFRGLLDRFGFCTTLRIWAGIAVGTSILTIFLVPTHPSNLTPSTQQTRRIPWQFLKHRTFYIYSVAMILPSSGYGIPQSYISQYAHEVTLLSQTWVTLLLTLFNIPGIISSSFFGYLSDNKHLHLSAPTVTSISAISSALSAFLFWGLTSQGSSALLVLFSITFGFFSSGYSSTWGAVLNDLEREAARKNEAIDMGMLYGLLNGARGIGYVSGGLASVPLLKAGSSTELGGFAYETTYGPLIIFTGLLSVFGGWGLLWKWKKLPCLV